MFFNLIKCCKIWNQIFIAASSWQTVWNTSDTVMLWNKDPDALCCTKQLNLQRKLSDTIFKPIKLKKKTMKCLILTSKELFDLDKLLLNSWIKQWGTLPLTLCLCIKLMHVKQMSPISEIPSFIRLLQFELNTVAQLCFMASTLCCSWVLSALIFFGDLVVQHTAALSHLFSQLITH